MYSFNCSSFHAIWVSLPVTTRFIMIGASSLRLRETIRMIENERANTFCKLFLYVVISVLAERFI